MPFIVAAVDPDGRYAYLCDGKKRRVESPKKKKIMHIQKTNTASAELREKILSKTVLNADIKKFISEYLKHAS